MSAPWKVRATWPGALSLRCVLHEIVPAGEARGGLTWGFVDACYALAYVVTHPVLEVVNRDELEGVARDLVNLAGRVRP